MFMMLLRPQNIPHPFPFCVNQGVFCTWAPTQGHDHAFWGLCHRLGGNDRNLCDGCRQ